MAVYNYNGVLRAFDPKAVTVKVGGLQLVGFSEEKVTVERANNSWELTVGCDGESTRVKSNDLSGTITITLQQTSPSNDYLTSIFYADEEYDTVTDIEVRDTSGRSQIIAAKAWCEKMPDATYGKNHSDRQWVFRTNNIQYSLAGNYESGFNAGDALSPANATPFTDGGSDGGGDPVAVNRAVAAVAETPYPGPGFGKAQPYPENPPKGVPEKDTVGE